jgi:sugar lactone lactonase YvrE
MSNVTTLAQAPNAWEIAIDQTHVYYTTRGNELPNGMLTDGTLQRVGKTGGAAQRLASTSGEPGSIALDEDSVYFTDKGAGTVTRIDKSAPLTPIGLAAYQPGPDGIALEGDNIFWACFNGDTVVRLPKQETRTVVLASGEGNPNSITVGGNFAYYSTYKGGSVSRVSASGGDVLLLAEVNAPIRMALDEAYLYFTGSGEEMGAHGVYRVPR